MAAPKRYLCWDKKLIETQKNTELQMHKTERKNIAVLCDNEWEGAHNGYSSVIRTADGYKFYYRADASRHLADGTMAKSKAVICVAESRDGKTFTKPNVGKFDFNGTKNNNIVFMRETFLDNFSVFYDDNPDCPADERIKALTPDRVDGAEILYYYASADGYDFRLIRALPIRGTFDTYNVVLWDADRKKYFLYYRAFHTADGTDVFSFRHMNIYKVIRDVRVATSDDFVNWTEHGRITFEGKKKDYQQYTNQIVKYFRSDDTFIGFPLRYRDRVKERRNFDFMPLGDRHRVIYEAFKREGTAVTDCGIMTSQDGFVFDRRDEAFATPGPEARDNWWYGNCGYSYGMIETEPDVPGAPKEISMFMGENYRIKGVNFARHTIRLDGFFSWFGRFCGGRVVTKPITVSAGEMRVNFATSALGGMRVTLLDESGKPIPGYKSYEMFGDSADRPVEFEKPLSELSGKKVKIKFDICDCHLYSFTL